MKKPYKYEAERKEAIRLMNKFQSENPYASIYGGVVESAQRNATDVCNQILRAMKAIPNIPKENIHFWKQVKKEIKNYKIKR